MKSSVAFFFSISLIGLLVLCSLAFQLLGLGLVHAEDGKLAKFPEARAIAYADDGYIKAKLSVALQVLAELKRVLKNDAGLELNLSNTDFLPKGVTQQAAFDAAQTIINASPTLVHLSADVLLASFCSEGFAGIGVPIGTNAFVRNFVAKTCRAIIDDVEKLDAIQDGFIHYQLLRFCQAT